MNLEILNDLYSPELIELQVSQNLRSRHWVSSTARGAKRNNDFSDLTGRDAFNIQLPGDTKRLQELMTYLLDTTIGFNKFKEHPSASW